MLVTGTPPTAFSSCLAAWVSSERMLLEPVMASLSTRTRFYFLLPFLFGFSLKITSVPSLLSSVHTHLCLWRLNSSSS